jgi:hypothetical protein
MYTELSFKIQTVRNNAAKMTYDCHSMTVKATEMKHLLYNVPTQERQLASYNITQNDLTEFVLTSTVASDFVPRK